MNIGNSVITSEMQIRIRNETSMLMNIDISRIGSLVIFYNATTGSTQVNFMIISDLQSDNDLIGTRMNTNALTWVGGVCFLGTETAPIVWRVIKVTMSDSVALQVKVVLSRSATASDTMTHGIWCSTANHSFWFSIESAELQESVMNYLHPLDASIGHIVHGWPVVDNTLACRQKNALSQAKTWHCTASVCGTGHRAPPRTLRVASFHAAGHQYLPAFPSACSLDQLYSTWHHGRLDPQDPRSASVLCWVSCARDR